MSRSRLSPKNYRSWPRPILNLPRVCRRLFRLRSRRHGGLLDHGIVAFLGFGWRDVADGLQQPAIAEPGHPRQRRELDSLECPPRSARMDDLGFVETVDGFGESIVVAVADVLPTEGSIPASAKRSVYLIETYIGRIQAVVATRSLSADRRNRSSASAGVFQSSVFRGRELRAAATAAISLALCRHRHVATRRARAL